jgi:hypothetical protein
MHGRAPRSSGRRLGALEARGRLKTAARGRLGSHIALHGSKVGGGGFQVVLVVAAKGTGVGACHAGSNGSEGLKNIK